MKNNSSLLFISILGITTFLCSCNPKFYAPTTATTPLFREKGETQFSGHIGAGDEIDRILQVQAACAIDSHLAVLGNLYTAETNYEENDPYRVDAGKGSQIEIAVGYFKPINSKLSYELYGGLAMGKVTNYYEKTYKSNTTGDRRFSQIISNKCFKPFVQGNFGYRSRKFDAIFNLRLGYLNLSGITETFATVDTGFIAVPTENIDKIKSNPNTFLLEPGFTIRFGVEPIKIQLHLGQSFSSKGTYPIDKTILSIGLVGMLNSSTSKKNHH